MQDDFIRRNYLNFDEWDRKKSVQALSLAVNYQEDGFDKTDIEQWFDNAVPRTIKPVKWHQETGNIFNPKVIIEWGISKKIKIHPELLAEYMPESTKLVYPVEKQEKFEVDYWLECDYWTLHESCFLLLGLTPDNSFFNSDPYSCSGFSGYSSQAIENLSVHDKKITR